MASKIYTIFDTETTGLLKHSLSSDDKQVRIIELAGVHMLADGTIVEEIELLFNPGIRLTDEIIGITGITNEKIADAKTWAEHSHEIAAFFSKGDALVAHNATFDADLIKMEMKRAGGIYSTFKFRDDQELICTVEATEFIKGKRLKLIDLYTHLFGEGFTGAHRAMTDVKALARITEQLILKGAI